MIQEWRDWLYGKAEETQNIKHSFEKSDLSKLPKEKREKLAELLNFEDEVEGEG